MLLFADVGCIRKREIPLGLLNVNFSSNDDTLTRLVVVQLKGKSYNNCGCGNVKIVDVHAVLEVMDQRREVLGAK